MGIMSGLLLGIVYVTAPGPIGIETLRQGMKGGFVAALAVQAGSTIGLIIYALLALFGAGVLLPEATWQLAAGVCGAAVLFYLGLTTIRDGRELVTHTGYLVLGSTSARHAFGTGAVLSLANPLEIVFWLALGSRLLHEPGLDGPAFLGAFFAGCTAASLLLVVFAGLWQSRLTDNTIHVISWTCGLALIGFGLKLGLSVSQQFMMQ